MTTTTTLSLNLNDANTLLQPHDGQLLFPVGAPSVAFIGKMGSGKTTAADYLASAYGYTRLSFAGILKDVAKSIWGEDVVTDRSILQEVGYAVRQIDEDAWVNALTRNLDKLSGPVVIDDCRFMNEYWALSERGFVFIRLLAEPPIRVDRLMRNGKLQDMEQLNHISEKGVDEMKEDDLIRNENQNLHSFLSAIDRVLKRAINQR